jgi:hypothetical protein
MFAPFAWWNGLSRQKRVGWLLVGASTIWLLYFMKTRLFAPGLPIERKEWVFFVLSFIGIMLGTINIRMAEMRERNQQFLPLGDVDNEGRPARKK